MLFYFLAGGAIGGRLHPALHAGAARSSGLAAAGRAAAGGGAGHDGRVIASDRRRLVLWLAAEHPDGARGSTAMFAPATQALTVRLTRIVMPAPALLHRRRRDPRAALMAHGRFASQALAPLRLQPGHHRGGAALLGSTTGRGGLRLGRAGSVPIAGPLLGLAWLEAARAPDALPAGTFGLRAVGPRASAPTCWLAAAHHASASRC